MYKVKIEEDKFCPKHGIIKGDFLSCPLCSQGLNQVTSYVVIRKCNSCGEEVEAPPSYFIERDHRCISCPGILVIPDTDKQTAPHFVLDGSWDGKDRSRIIKEKNEQLKRKNSGYEHEQQSIKEKTTKALQEKGIL